MRVRRSARAGLLAGALLLALAGAPWPGLARAADEERWIAIDYRALVDERQLSHSGESVAQLLAALDGRPVPPDGERPGDLLLHRLLDPLLEPYAFVLSDALDTLAPPAREAPLVEVGGLWRPGEAQPAWVELARARAWLVESDGRGRLRAILPDPRPLSEAVGDPAVAARLAWEAAWPGLRHALAAERRRLGAPALAVEVWAYRHEPARTRFALGRSPWRVEIDDTRPDGRRPPLDLGAWEGFLASGLRLEGARLDSDGTVRLLGSQPPAGKPPALLGRPIALADLAVAHRAVFHGGLAEPYMSLDRGLSPQTSIVNYGGRLRDTALGLVSLLCDVRFKTFSQGLDVLTGADLRDELRARLPAFRAHLERMAAHPASAGLSAQQTRLWFYPDDVDLTLSAEGDVLVLRRVRMSAASERVSGASMTAAAGEEDPPWTRATVVAINEEYDRLAEFFPELGDLDQVVRLLSLFTWLREVEREGMLLPDLDALLAVELPALPTPRRFPQQLAFLALPPAGSEAPVTVFDRLAVGDALDRLAPRGERPLDPAARYRRALAALDPAEPQHAALLEELAGVDPARADASALDLLAYRAERLRMHELVLGTLDLERRRRLAERQAAGDELRVFSTGIGGLDLGMSDVVARAGGRRLGLVAGAAGAVSARAPARRSSGEPREAWRAGPAEVRPAELPPHGVDGADRPSGFVVEAGGAATAGGRRRVGWIQGADGPAVTARWLELDEAGRVEAVERVEQGRRIVYRLEAGGPSGLVAVALAEPAPTGPPAAGDGALPPGLLVLAVGGADPAAAAVPVRLSGSGGGARRNLQADFPRSVLTRLVLGPDVDPGAGAPLPGLAPLPPGLGEARAVMVELHPALAAPPWSAAARPLPGEEDAARLAPALTRFWREVEKVERTACVGVDPERSPARWAAAPEASGAATLVLPPAAFTAATFVGREALAAAWNGRVVDEPPATLDGTLLVLVSGEPPDLFAARMRELAARPAMRGKLLAGLSLAGPVRADLASSLLAENEIAAVGLAGAEVLELRRAPELLDELSRAARASPPRRAEALPGPFVWSY